MIIHTTLIKLKKEADEKIKNEYIENIKNNIIAMKENIPGISEVEFSQYDDIIPFASYDLILNTKFKDKEGYKDYMSHPLHAKAHDYADSVSDSIATITYSKRLI